MHAKTEGDLANVAEALRTITHQSEPPFSVEDLLGAWPDAVAVGRVLPDGIDELMSIDSQGVLIVYRYGLSSSEQRMAVAHALAHLIYDVGVDGVVAGVPFTVERRSRADEFARELLAPDRLLEAEVHVWPQDGDAYDVQVDSIAQHFGVPYIVIDQRIRELQSTQNRAAETC